MALNNTHAPFNSERGPIRVALIKGLLLAEPAACFSPCTTIQQAAGHNCHCAGSSSISSGGDAASGGDSDDHARTAFAPVTAAAGRRPPPGPSKPWVSSCADFAPCSTALTGDITEDKTGDTGKRSIAVVVVGAPLRQGFSRRPSSRPLKEHHFVVAIVACRRCSGL
jgi:hypothetical protein